MALLNRKKKIPLTIMQVISWLDYCNGVSIAASAERLQVNPTTIQKHRAKATAVLGPIINIDDYRLAVHKLYPLALKSLMKNLEAGKEATTIAFFKGIQAFVDKAENDLNMRDMSDDKLSELIRKYISPPSGTTDPTGPAGGGETKTDE
jgi:hypothetical protein